MSRLDANAVTTTYTYDVVDRLTGINYGDTTPDVTFTYDALGNRLTMVDGAGTTEYTYDALYRRTSIEDGQNNVVGYDYDDAGRLVELTYPGGTDSVTYDYDDSGRLTDVTDWLSNVTTYTYDAANRLTGTTLGNGLISDRTYDDADRLTNLTNRTGGTPISSYTYTLDDVGNRTQMVDTTGTTTYTYDDLYRLTDVTYPNTDVQTYDYDAMGNRTEKTHNTVPTSYSYDDADQMTLAGGVSYDYDDKGNQIEAGTDTFEWDAENRLIETDIASTTGTYEYNGDGMRTTRTIGASAVSYVWDLNAGLPVILEDTDGKRYVYGLDLLTRIDGTDEEWYLCDGLGSTTALADASGAVTGTYEYDAFGAVRAHSGDATEWSYTGEQNDPTGLEYLRARFYDAGTGRFLSQDPLPLVQRYPYASNNPTNLVDPSGALPCWKLCDAVECARNAVQCGMDAFIDSLPEKTLFSYNGSYHVSLQLFVTCTVQYPAACVAALNAAIVARSMTALIYGEHSEGQLDQNGNVIGGGNYEGDSFEHCAWSGLTTLQVGAEQAEKVLRRYEARENNPQEFRDFDFANNKRGRDFASTNPASGPAGVLAYCRFG